MNLGRFIDIWGLGYRIGGTPKGGGDFGRSVTTGDFCENACSLKRNLQIHVTAIHKG